jgi:hypothetical protein
MPERATTASTYRSSYGKVAAETIAGRGSTCSVREDTLLPAIERFFAAQLFGLIRLDLLREQLGHRSAPATPRRSKQPRGCKRRSLSRSSHRHAGAGSGARDRGRGGQGPDRGTEAEKAATQASLPKLTLATERTDAPLPCSVRCPTSPSGRDADDATKRALFDAFDLRVIFDKARDRPSISATLTEAVAKMLRDGLEPLSSTSLRGWDSNPQPIG